MRIGIFYKPQGWNVAYRAQAPAAALEARGHDIRLVVRADDNSFDGTALLGCDVVHIYRMADDAVRRLTAELQRCGVAVVWDNDDDVRLMPAQRQRELQLNPYRVEREWQLQARMMRRADVVTTTTDYLADAFRAAGAPHVTRIPNYLFEAQYRRSRGKGSGITIGWVAGAEHEADERALHISEMLAQALERHRTLRVVTIGLPLRLDRARYEHHRQIPLRELNDIVRHFHVAIAPLADIPMSYARSNVKVKEYAAAQVPWLASARGPYADMGGPEGGILVQDHEWGHAIDTLVTSRFKRFRLSRSAASWAKSQLIDRHVAEWEGAFEAAITRRHATLRSNGRAGTNNRPIAPETTPRRGAPPGVEAKPER